MCQPSFLTRSRPSFWQLFIDGENARRHDNGCLPAGELHSPGHCNLLLFRSLSVTVVVINSLTSGKNLLRCSANTGPPTSIHRDVTLVEGGTRASLLYSYFTRHATTGTTPRRVYRLRPPLALRLAAGGEAAARAPRSRPRSSCAADPSGRPAGTCRTACCRSRRP